MNLSKASDLMNAARSAQQDIMEDDPAAQAGGNGSPSPLGANDILSFDDIPHGRSSGVMDTSGDDFSTLSATGNPLGMRCQALQEDNLRLINMTRDLQRELNIFKKVPDSGKPGSIGKPGPKIKGNFFNW